MSSAAKDYETELVEAAGLYWSDPLGFVKYSYPWGEQGPLKEHSGPDQWQVDLLQSIAAELKTHKGKPPFLPIRRAISSGHGIGKTTIVAWLVNWIMVTRPKSHGTITANTFDQLETKTWAAVQKWTNLCIFSHWFECNSRMLYAKGDKSDWFCAAQSSKEENSEAFAGQHAEGGSSFYIFDEDSAIPDRIHEVAEGGLTDGEPMIFLFGNPTRNTGHFYKACFGSGRDSWNPMSVDSRTSKFTNKVLIEEWLKEHGEDSDFFRVRVRGLPPSASELQFIDQQRIWDAQKRPMPTVFADEPLICGVDVSDGGSAYNVVAFRRGGDARSVPFLRVPGEAVRGDRSFFLAKLVEILEETYGGRKVDMMFFDSAFGAPYVERLARMGYKNVQEIRFGGDSPDRHQLNMRAHMWSKMKDWLLNGAISTKDQVLESDLGGPGYRINTQDRLVLESKADMLKRNVASPDNADALALTFAMNLGPAKKKAPRGSVPADWNWSRGWSAVAPPNEGSDDL